MKIAFFDIDGTMVNVPGGMLHPSEETKRVIQEFQKQGNYIVVAIARGKLPQSVIDIDFDGKICSDGHYIEFQDEVLVDNNFSESDLKMQIELYDKFNAEYSFGGQHGHYATDSKGPLMMELSRQFGGGSKNTDRSDIGDLSKIVANSATPLFDRSNECLHVSIYY